jgi:hypothetical protein
MMMREKACENGCRCVIADGKFQPSEFSNCLYRFNFNFYELVVPDLLHEFELGVWKDIFVHLI